MSVLEAVGWALLHFLWQGTLVGAVVAIALASMRRASAAARYAVAVGTLFAMVLLPAVTAWRHVGAGATTRPASGVAEPSAILAPPSAPPLDDRAQPPAIDRASAARLHAGHRTPPLRADAPARTTPRRMTAPGIDAVLPWLVGTWACGVLALSVRLFGGWLRARRLSSTGLAPVPASCQAALVRLAARLGVGRTVRVFESCLIEVPVAIGWLRPVVLLPASAFSGLTVDQLDAILAHELAHIRRHDFIVNLAQSVIETVLFYHPAVWWVSRQVRLEREHCCDDLAVLACGDRAGYARALVGMERLRQPVPALAVRANGGSLVMRVRRLLSTEVTHAEPAPRWAASVIALSTALTVGVAAGMPVVTLPLEGAASEVSAPLRAAQAAAPTIVQSSDPATPFAERWASAEREARTRAWPAYWVGFAVRPPAGLHGFIYSDRHSTVTGPGISLSGTFSGRFEHMQFPGVSIAPLVGGGDPDRIKLLFSFDARAAGGPAVTRRHFSSFVLPVDLGNQPLFWLGQADASQSLPVVERLYAEQSDQKAKEDLVTAIGLHGDSSLVAPALVRILTSGESATVRAEAAERLGWHSVPASLAALERAARGDLAAEVRREAAEAIGDLDLPEATPTLIGLAKTLDDRQARREAVEALGKRPEPSAREALVAIARTDRDVDIQREAVETLGELHDPQAVAALADLARTHPSVDVRREAIETIGEAMPAAQAVPFLVRAAREDTSVDVQREAVETLGEIKDARAVAAILEIARTHRSPDVRREAIETVGDAMPSDEAAAVLARVAREDASVDVQREAVETLGELAGGRGIAAVRELARTHPSAEVRREAIETLGGAGATNDVVEVLAHFAREDASADVQREAVETLGEVTDGRGLAEVAKLALSHPVADVRREAIETLVEHAPHATAIDILGHVVADDRDQNVRHEALEGLAELPDGAGIPTLLEIARSSPDQDIRREALKCLVDSEDPRARALLDRALAKP